MHIRPVKDTDFPGLIWEGLEEWEEVISTDFREKGAKQLIWLVAKENNEPIGQVIATMKGKSGKPYLFALRVRSDYQQKGIGTRLIKEQKKSC